MKALRIMTLCPHMVMMIHKFKSLYIITSIMHYSLYLIAQQFVVHIEQVRIRRAQCQPKRNVSIANVQNVHLVQALQIQFNSNKNWTPILCTNQKIANECDWSRGYFEWTPWSINIWRKMCIKLNGLMVQKIVDDLEAIMEMISNGCCIHNSNKYLTQILFFDAMEYLAIPSLKNIS